MATLASQLEQLENAQLVRRALDEESAYLFKHALTQESAYESLLLKTRREMHLRVAAAYEQVYPNQLDELAAVLAAHYAEAGDNAKTAVFAQRAGQHAASISAYTEANAHFTAALEALSRLTDTEQNRRARVDTTLNQINVAWGIDSADLNLKRLFQAEALAQTLPEGDRLRLARIHYWIGRVYSYRNEGPTAASYYDQVMTVADEFADEELIGFASALRGRTLFLQGYFGKAVPLLEQALPHLERIGDWYEWILAKVFLAIARAGQGHSEEGRLMGEQAIQKALSLNDRVSLAIAYLMSARVEFMAGELERMLDIVRVWVKEAEATNPLVHYMALGFQAWAECRLGMPETARATMAAADAIAARFGTRLIFHDWFAAARAEIEFNAGHVEQALQLAQEAVDEAQATGGVFSAGIAQRVWGQALAAVKATDDTLATAHLETSLRLFQEGEALIEAARTHVAWGQVLQMSGNASAAREHFEKAAAQFETSGLTSELEKTKKLTYSLSS